MCPELLPFVSVMHMQDDFEDDYTGKDFFKPSERYDSEQEELETYKLVLF